MESDKERVNEFEATEQNRVEPFPEERFNEFKSEESSDDQRWTNERINEFNSGEETIDDDIPDRNDGTANEWDEEGLVDPEEFAAEVAAPAAGAAVGMPVRPLNNPEEDRPAYQEINREKDKNSERSANRTMGYIAIALAIISLFIWPVVLGPAAAVVGFIAYRQGSRTMGIWSIVIGLISLIAYMVLAPFFG